ncbi:MAG: hypothetical protein ACKO1M_07180 [Planctomycetota bacterium]
MTARFAAALAVGWLCASLAGPTWAAERLPSTSGLSAGFADMTAAGRESCRRALAELPLERMTAEHRQIAEHFGRSATLHRRLPAETIHCEPALLDFVLSKPETLVDVWRVLGISRVALDPVAANTWRLSDGYGTTGTVRLIHHDHGPGGGLLVFHGRGGYDGPLAPKPLTGSCLLVVRHAPTADADQPAQRVEVEAFLDVDGLGLEIVTRTLQPLIVRSAAANVHEICLFVSQFARAADRNPAGVARLADRMSRTPPADLRTLATLAAGASGTPPVRTAADTSPERVREELAARWLPAEALDATRR